jgi:hypothetical protein
MWGGLRESWGHTPTSRTPSISSSWRLRVHMAEGACIALFFAVPVPSVDPVRSAAPPSLHSWRQRPLSPSPSSSLHLPFLNPTMSESSCISCCGLTDIWTHSSPPRRVAHAISPCPHLPDSEAEGRSNIREAPLLSPISAPMQGQVAVDVPCVHVGALVEQ